MLDASNKWKVNTVDGLDSRETSAIRVTAFLDQLSHTHAILGESVAVMSKSVN